MTVVFDAGPLLAFAFDEPGAEAVEEWLDRVYDGDRAGYVATITLAEVRYIAARKASPEEADAHIRRLRELGLTEYEINDCWQTVAELRRQHALALGDAYVVAAAVDLDGDSKGVTLLVGADDDFDAVENDPDLQHLFERFRTESV
jgi:predicted nucleic acid-binding protein